MHVIIVNGFYPLCWLSYPAYQMYLNTQVDRIGFGLRWSHTDANSLFVNGRCHCLRHLEKGIHSNGHAHGFRPQAQKLPCESTSQKEAYLNGDMVSFRSRI